MIVESCVHIVVLHVHIDAIVIYVPITMASKSPIFYILEQIQILFYIGIKKTKKFINYIRY